jgi:hypothetical protein
MKNHIPVKASVRMGISKSFENSSPFCGRPVADFFHDLIQVIPTDRIDVELNQGLVELVLPIFANRVTTG